MANADTPLRIHEKWGFGMAPVKPETQDRRVAAALAVLAAVQEQTRADGDALSEVRGLFNRTWRQDQWDWFTVWTQLGRPGQRRAQAMGQGLHDLRRAVDGDTGAIDAAVATLQRHGIEPSLRRFTAGDNRSIEAGVGYVYILSTRSKPTLLKIGYTERSVETRVREINAATGVVEPFGVRAVWTVRHARHVETAVHDALAPHRIRADREFFDIEYRHAFAILREVVYRSRQEL